VTYILLLCTSVAGKYNWYKAHRSQKPKLSYETYNEYAVIELS